MKNPFFESQQFFDETVLPTIAEDPAYLKEGKLPLLADTLPVGDFDDCEHFDYYPCRLAYFPVSKTTEIGLITMEESVRLPARVQTFDISMPDSGLFEAVLVARKKFNYVIGLRSEQTGDWHRVERVGGVAKYLLDIIRAKVVHSWNKFPGSMPETADPEEIRLLREADSRLRTYRPELTKEERDKIRHAWSKDIRLSELSSPAA